MLAAVDRTHLGSRAEAARSPRMGTGRFAPSPTGELHLGNLRTALLAWALARRAGLRFVIRMEDLDDRCRPEFAARQLATLRSLGVDWDGPVVYQSERLGLYEAAFQELNRRGLVYECYCTRRDLAGVVSAPHSPPGAYPGTCRELSEAQRRAGRARMAGLRRGPAYRLCTDNGRIDVVDEVQGAYRGTVDDFVIRRGDGAFSYNFVAVYDDGLQGVSQVVRGEDLLASTPRHVYLQREFGFATPAYAHVPMLLNGQGIRLAKRDGAVTMADLAAFGWKPADVIGLLGLSLGMEGVRSADEFMERLTLGRLRRESSPVYPAILEKGSEFAREGLGAL